ncbi:Hypothetical protein A7982_09927 [Minicystis rosea]|nr:Hypothetical protein A7982_09927 [Minicystis rosea]
MGFIDGVRSWWSRRGQAAPKDAIPPPAPPLTSSPPQHESGPRTGWVSVWIGDFRSELDYDGYSGREFCRDHGAKPFHDGEYTVHPAPEPLEALLAKFSQSFRWRDAILDAARAQGITHASCALAREHYYHAPATTAPGPMRFVASVPMEKRER